MLAYSRKNRRNSRQSRKNRRATRHRRNNRRNMNVANGGSYSVRDISPLELNDTSMMSPQKLSVAQGQQFADLTKNMHGGMGTYPNSVTDSVLQPNLHASARLIALDRSYNEIVGLKDQTGGRKSRSKAGRKGRKSSRKNRRSTRRSRKHRGGGPLGYMSVDAPGMLLDAQQTARAGLNPEWKLAENVNSFAPTK